MIFERIIIENLFSYTSRQDIDLRGAEPGRNICLIMGRNGFGKTSLLNCIKLLFTGTTDDRVRTVGVPPRRLQPGPFVRGDGAAWSGILNSQGRELPASISITWRDGEQRVTATRSWTPVGSSHVEDLIIDEESGNRVVREEAQKRLNDYCPREFVSFFFFDAEQIQELADAGNDQRTQEIDRLLRLTYLDAVRDQLSSLLTEYRRADLPVTVRRQIAEQEAEISRLTAEQAEKQRLLHDLIRDQEQTRAEQTELERRRDGLRTGGSLVEKQRIEKEIADLSEQIGEEQRALADNLPILVPLLANPALVERGLATLNALIDHRLSSGAQIIEALKNQLPSSLLETPPFPNPRLTRDQIAFLKERLQRFLAVFTPSDSSAGSVLSIGASEAEEVRGQLVELAGSGIRLRTEIARRLRALGRDKVRLRELNRRQVDLEVQGEEDRQRYARLTSQIEKGRNKLEELAANRREHENNIALISKKLEATNEIRQRLESKIGSATEADRRIQITRNSLDLLNEFKAQRRSSLHDNIENMMNLYYNKLMTSHDLVKKIRLSEDYGFDYLNDEDKPIGRLSISHGMRQIAATAFLWALKDVSGKKLPVVIDTPLARIDRGNQENLLKYYYPNAAQQVILLATDSEMTPDKYDLIKAQIYRRYTLHNRTGRDSQLLEDTAKLVRA
jgi:DNA sulfur modification protein DndD